jgi:prolyl 4-hydroxylase
VLWIPTTLRLMHIFYQLSSERHFEVAKIYPGDSDHVVDTESRVSQLAFLKQDQIYHRVQDRAMRLQGWRGGSTFVQPMYVQRYTAGGFYKEHYDWDPSHTRGNRVTTFMVYLTDDYAGGETFFPRLRRPRDSRWCDVIKCYPKDDARWSLTGVTFKPKKGSAVFWENMHANESFNEDMLHSSLEVERGVKLGLNIFSWDLDWRAHID